MTVPVDGDEWIHYGSPYQQRIREEAVRNLEAYARTYPARILTEPRISTAYDEGRGQVRVVATAGVEILRTPRVRRIRVTEILTRRPATPGISL